MTRKITFDIEAVDKTGDAIDQVEEKLGDAGNAVEGSGLQFTELNSIMEVGNKVFDVAKQAYAALIQPTIDLGLATSRLSGSLGITTEDASTMIQMLEDYGLTQEETTSAMEAAVRRGYAPTIDGLAQMADELVGIQDPVKQGALLFDVFGKKGQEVGKLLRGGSADVLAASKEVAASGRALSQDQVDDVLKYRDALNDLGDVWAAVGMGITKDFLPPITQALIDLEQLITLRDRLGLSFTDTGERMAVEGRSYDEYITAALNVAQANGMLSETQRIMIDRLNASGAAWDVNIQGSGVAADKLGILTRAEFDNVMSKKAEAEAAAELKKQTEDLAAAQQLAISAGLTGTIQKATESYIGKIGDLDVAHEKSVKNLEYWQGVVKRAPSMVKNLTAEMAAFAQEGDVNSDTYKKMQTELTKWQNVVQAGPGALAELNGKVDEATKAQQDAYFAIINATTALMNQTLMAGLTGDKQLEVARALGILSEADYAATIAAKAIRDEFDKGKISAEQMAAKTKELSDWIAGLESKNITVTTEFIEIHRNVLAGQVWNGVTGPGAGVMGGGGATGINNMIVPPGFNRDNYLLPLSSGERVDVTPASRVGPTNANTAGSVVYNFNATGITDPEQFLDWCGQRVKEQGGL